MQPIESDGELSIAGLRAHTLWEYLEDRLNFVIDSGTIDVQSTYKFALKDAIELQLNVAKASLSDFAVKPRNSDLAWVSVPQLTVTGTNVDLAQRLVQVDSVAMSGVKLSTWLEPNGSLNLMQLAAQPTVAASAPPSAAPTLSATNRRERERGRAGGPGDAGAPWRVELKGFDLRDASIFAEDRSVQPADQAGAGAALRADRPGEPRSEQAGGAEARYPHQRYRVARGERAGDATTRGGLAEGEVLRNRSLHGSTVYRPALVPDPAQRKIGR